MSLDPIEACHRRQISAAKRDAQIELQRLPKTEEEIKRLSAEELIRYRADVENIYQEVEMAEKNLEAYQKRQKDINEKLNDATVIFEHNNEREMKEMENNKDLEVRSLQKYLTTEFKQMNEIEQRALDLNGAAAVVPKDIVNVLITDGKYSTLLSRATVFGDSRPGKLSIPIASHNAAVWKDENADADANDATYEKSPNITNIQLGAHELYRWMRMSSAAYSMSSAEFQEMMLNLLSSEVIEELEKAFVDGTGIGQPKGLEAVNFTDKVNAVEVATGGAIAPKDIADAISLLPAKHARNAIVMCNTGTLAAISLFKGTSEYAFDISQGANSLFGHEIVVNEHVDDDVVYIVDPSELYVRFAMPLQVEANKSSGFTKASVDLRALTVVDAAWNDKAVSKVYIKAA